MALTVPPIRKSMGWKPAERIPTTFPRQYWLVLFDLVWIPSAVLLIYDLVLLP
jgi:hypothetical protein